MGSPESVSAVPSVPHKGSCRSAAVPEPPSSVPEVVPAAPAAIDQGQPIAVDGETGWRLPGALPPGNAPTNKVVVVDPHGATHLVERSRITHGAAKSRATPANSLTIQVDAPAAPAPTLRELIAQAQAEGLAGLDLQMRVQNLHIAAGIDQPCGAVINQAMEAMG